MVQLDIPIQRISIYTVKLQSVFDFMQVAQPSKRDRMRRNNRSKFSTVGPVIVRSRIVDTTGNS